MTNELLPKWVMKRYLILWDEFEDRKFTFPEALAILKRSDVRDDEGVVKQIMSQLRKAGWVEVRLNEKDARRRDYQLRNYERIFHEITMQCSGRR